MSENSDPFSTVSSRSFDLFLFTLFTILAHERAKRILELSVGPLCGVPMNTKAKVDSMMSRCLGFAAAFTRLCLIRIPPKLWPISMRGLREHWCLFMERFSRSCEASVIKRSFPDPKTGLELYVYSIMRARSIYFGRYSSSQR